LSIGGAMFRLVPAAREAPPLGQTGVNGELPARDAICRRKATQAEDPT
jgi:hypothetical protein